MNDLSTYERRRALLELAGQLPARLTAEETACLLGFQSHDIPVLVGQGLLKPLGRPGPNSVRYFAAFELRELAQNRSWLAKATDAIAGHWREKNSRKQSKSLAPLSGAA